MPFSIARASVSSCATTSLEAVSISSSVTFMPAASSSRLIASLSTTTLPSSFTVTYSPLYPANAGADSNSAADATGMATGTAFLALS